MNTFFDWRQLRKEVPYIDKGEKVKKGKEYKTKQRLCVMEYTETRAESKQRKRNEN